MKKRLSPRGKGGLFILAGISALAIPLVRDFHIESAMLVSIVGCFWAALRGCYTARVAGQDDLKPALTIVGYTYIFGLPLFLFALFTGCFSINGLGFWILYPIPSIIFGYAIGRLLQIWRIPFRRVVAIVILIFIAVGVFLFEFFHFPQVYFFNQIWGGWPGPIYDETVKVSWSLVYFRALTFMWIGLLWWTPAVIQSTKAKVIVVICGILLILGYSWLPQMGIISPRSYLQKKLGGEKKTAHFKVYYDKNHYTDDEINFIAQRQEFYYQAIADILKLGEPDTAHKIESYFYAHPWQKKKLVGAKFTSYVPIWLEQGQLHVAKEQIPESLKHELVHVMAKRFGNKLFNGSWSIGLIEGLAVAISGDESPVSTINQIVVSEKPYPSAREMKEAFSPWGFYKGRSAVNYTQSGSFVQYLLQNYPVKKLEKAYRNGSIAGAYNVSWNDLVAGWHAALDTISVDSTDQKVAARLYSIPSLFEQKCPHVQSRFAQKWDRYLYFMAEQDTAKALQQLDDARKASGKNPAVQSQWDFLNLKAGHVKKIEEQPAPPDTTIDELLLYADAFALDGKTDSARFYVSKVERFLKARPDTSRREALRTRKDSMQWKWYRNIIYKYKTAPDSIFENLYGRTQARAIRQAIEHHQWGKMKNYAKIAQNRELSPANFDTYNQLIEWLAFFRDRKLTDKWIKKVQKLSLRRRYRQRINETSNWIKYLQTSRFVHKR